MGAEGRKLSRVAVVGAGVAGLGAASALVLAARARGRTVDVTVLEGSTPEADRGPVVLTPECRSRLAALGCRVPLEWRMGALRGVEVISGSQRELLPAPSSGLWVVDGWAEGVSGQERLRQVMRAGAVSLGVRMSERRVDAVERVPPVPGTPAGRGAGDLLVRCGGWLERFDAAVLAAGAGASGAGHLQAGYEAPPTLPAVQARLRGGNPRLPGAAVARVWLAPLPGMDALLLIPCLGSVYALGVGPSVEAADLCQALMMASRDGLLEEGFEVASVTPLRVPCGVGQHLVAEGQLAVGAAAMGSPLQLGLSTALATSSRAAAALMEVGTDARALRRRYVTEGLAEMLGDARAGARALRWLPRCGGRGARAFVEAARTRSVEPWAGGVLGLSSPTPRALLRTARWGAVREWMDRLVSPPLEEAPVAAAPLLEPELYYVVDDDPEAREALCQLLEAQGARVVCFADELALYGAVARRPPTAILLDVVLQWVDGLRLCEGLKRHPSTRDTRVVVMSGLNRPHVRERAFRAGAEAFLPKPIAPAELLQVLVHGRPAALHEAVGEESELGRSASM